MATEYWTIKHFSQANAAGIGQDDVPALPRRVAESIEALGPVQIQDITFSVETAAEGERPSMTVYFDDRPAGT